MNLSRQVAMMLKTRVDDDCIYLLSWLCLLV